MAPTPKTARLSVRKAGPRTPRKTLKPRSPRKAAQPQCDRRPEWSSTPAYVDRLLVARYPVVPLVEPSEPIEDPDFNWSRVTNPKTAFNPGYASDPEYPDGCTPTYAPVSEFPEPEPEPVVLEAAPVPEPVVPKTTFVIPEAVPRTPAHFRFLSGLNDAIISVGRSDLARWAVSTVVAIPTAHLLISSVQSS